MALGLDVTAVDAPAAYCVPVTSDGMTSEDAATTSALFKALSDPGRVRIVNILATRQDAICVCDLVETLGLSQATVSFHVKKLLDVGLLEREQRGSWAYYSLNRTTARRLGDVLRFEGGRV